MIIRTITVGLELDFKDTAKALDQLNHATGILERAREQAERGGLEVQTVRISLVPFLGEFENAADRFKFLQALDKFCLEKNISFLSLGYLLPGQLPPEETVEILANFKSFNLSTVIAREGIIDPKGIFEAAEIIPALAQATPDGFSNFRYCAIANCPPGIPFFPASYQTGGGLTLSLGLQMPDLARETISKLEPRIASEGPAIISSELAGSIYENLLPLQKLFQKFCLEEDKIIYRGIDTSLAPLSADSVAGAIEAANLGQFGESGTLAVCEAITAGLQQVKKVYRGYLEEEGLLTTGYCGLMLPVLEDAIIGQRVKEGLVDIQKLMLYSAVCGTGLDVVPLPGETSQPEIRRMLFDLAGLSSRYRKPLSARLFPVPGKLAGELTNFESIYFTNCPVMQP